MTRSRWKNRIAMLAAALLAALLLPLRALALGRPDTTETCSLTLTASSESAAVPGMRFALLRAAELDSLGRWTLTAEFSASGVEPGALAAAQDFAAAARTLRDFAAGAGLAPDADAVTDEAGNAAFSGLEPGLYLVTAAPAADGGYEYGCAPFLLALPALSADGARWDYDAAALPKLSRRALPPPPAPDTPPEPEATPAPDPEPTETPAPPAPTEAPPVPTPTPEGPSADGDTLPQTGQLRWPVPALAALGLLLAAAGVRLRRRARDD